MLFRPNLWLLLAIISLFVSCNEKYKCTLMVSLEDQAAMEDIAQKINSHSRFQIEVITRDSVTEVSAIDQLLDGDFDMTSVDNTIDYHKSKKDIRTVIPFFHEVLVILAKEELSTHQIDSLLREKDYLILSKELDELDFYRRFIPHYTGDSTLNYRVENHFQLKEDLEESSLVLFFSDRNNLELGKLLFNNEAYIHSLDSDEHASKGSFIDGFCQDYKKTTPYTLSRYAFGVTLEKPIYTLAVHELLVSHADIEAKVIYDLIKTIHQHHIVKIFESSNSYLFEANHQDIILSFPFHQGTIDYLNRDQPTFVERYADVMGFALSAFVLLFGVFGAVRTAVLQRKKDRIDKYYHDLLSLKEDFHKIPNKELRKKLTAMQKTVFDLLIKEKLSASNEFVIFMMLWDELHQELLNESEVELWEEEPIAMMTSKFDRIGGTVS